jgi:ABC-type transport system involved in cytochrome c biogenesis permease subunit
MPSEPMAPLLAGAFFLLAAAAYAWRWRVAGWSGAAGAAALTGALIARGLRASHWPLTGEYEFALAFALGTALATLTFDLRGGLHIPAVQAAAMGATTALVVYARLLMPAFQRAIQPLLPALDSVWLPLHAGAAALAYGALTVAGMAGLVWLVHQPERSVAEYTLDRAIAAGYPLLTLSMILGMIWAQVAWGRYWGWDLKEVWTLITWLVYTLYWHLRNRRGWQGRRLAGLALLGLGAVLFTFLGTGGLARQVGLESLHLF